MLPHPLRVKVQSPVLPLLLEEDVYVKWSSPNFCSLLCPLLLSGHRQSLNDWKKNCISYYATWCHSFKPLCVCECVFVCLCLLQMLSDNHLVAANEKPVCSLLHGDGGYACAYTQWKKMLLSWHFSYCIFNIYQVYLKAFSLLFK